MFCLYFGVMSKIYKNLSRRKTQETEDITTQLNRVLGLADLLGIGVGTTLGLGIYILAGLIAAEYAGPGVIISFLISALTAGLSGLCYAEFAARAPKAGSAYVYSYMSIGEFVAFSIGWTMMCEFMIGRFIDYVYDTTLVQFYSVGTAAIASGFVTYLDVHLDNRLRDSLNSTMPINIEFFGPYVNLYAGAAVLLLTILLSFGIRQTSTFNIICVSSNLLVIFIVVIGGLFYGIFKNDGILEKISKNMSFSEALKLV